MEFRARFGERMNAHRRHASLIVLVLASLMAGALGIETRSPKPPKPSGKVIVVRETLTLDRRNTTYDYEGATIVWKGEGDCSQKENMPPIFRITGNGITVKNATIIGAPDGIHIDATSTFNTAMNSLRCDNNTRQKKDVGEDLRELSIRFCLFPLSPHLVPQSSECVSSLGRRSQTDLRPFF